MKPFTLQIEDCLWHISVAEVALVAAGLSVEEATPEDIVRSLHAADLTGVVVLSVECITPDVVSKNGYS